jgi:hypothetical protein
MGRQVAIALYVAAMAAVIVGVDVVFFRDRFWERLMANIGIVLVFAAFYLRFPGVDKVAALVKLQNRPLPISKPATRPGNRPLPGG